MKVIYKATIAEQIKNAIAEAKSLDKEIECIELTDKEFKELGNSESPQHSLDLLWGVKTPKAAMRPYVAFEGVRIKVI